MKFYIYLGIVVGSVVGSLLPALFGAGMLSAWGILGSTSGGIAGIFLGYKMGKSLGV